MTGLIYESPNARITDAVTTLRGKPFRIEDIAEVAPYDERTGLRRLALFGLAVSAVTFILRLVGINVVPEPLPAVSLFMSSGILAYQWFRLSAGLGLLIVTKNGGASLIKGLDRQDVAALRAAIETARRSA